MAIVRTLVQSGFEPGDDFTGTDSSQAEDNDYWSTCPTEGATLSEVAIGSSAAPAPRTGSRCNRILVLDGDHPSFSSTTRGEWQHYGGDSSLVGSRTWYRFSFYIPSNYRQNTDSDAGRFRIIFQFHEAEGSPVFAFMVNDKNDGQLIVRQKDEDGPEPNDQHFVDFPLADLDDVFDRWIDFVVGAKWSAGSDGWFKCYMDGELVINYTGNTKTFGSVIYTKHGAYGNDYLGYIDDLLGVEVDDDADYYNEMALDVDPGGSETGEILSISQSSDDVRMRANGTDYLENNPYIIVWSNPDSAVRVNSAVRFNNIPWSDGAVIVSAKLVLNVDSEFRDSPDCLIYLVNESNPATFNSTNRRPISDDLSLAGSPINWTDVDLGTGPADSPDITSLINAHQALGGGSGRSIAFLLEGKSTGNQGISSVDYSTGGTATQLVVEFIEPNFREVDGVLPEQSGNVNRVLTLSRNLFGSVPSIVGSVSSSPFYTRLLSGTLPTAVGTVNTFVGQATSHLQGGLGEIVGTLATTRTFFRVVEGHFPQGTGRLREGLGRHIRMLLRHRW